MKDAGGKRPPEDAADEPFLERWSRRKAQAREEVDEEPPAPEAEAGGEFAARPDEVVPPVELPDIDSLTEDSDYSAFMAPGVDGSVRRRALRKLFSSPKFNIRDGLDDYCDDFTQWAPLGDIVTADMRYHLERAAKLAEKLEEMTGPGEHPARPEAVAAAAAAPVEPPAPEPPPEHATDDPERDA